MMKALFLLTLFFFTLSGCTTNYDLTKEFVADLIYREAPPNKSIITGSVDLFGGNYGWYDLKQISTGKTQIISATNRNDKLTWRSSGGYGRTFLLELDPGKYEIFSWTYFMPAAGGESKLTPREMKPITLDLKPGESIYLGSFNFKTTYGKNTFGITIPAGVKINITNEKSRDFENLKKKYPQLLLNKIETKLINYSL